MTNIFIPMIGLVVGGFIGVAFGAIQNFALRRNEKRQENGNFKSGWVVMPGSMTRVAFLMIALALVQVGMPMLFTSESQWLVSAGVVLGYGGMLYAEFRRKVHAI
jgi:hypothetical protein